ncbi:MAG TPA: DeoR/GlpR family DNA-binding transcription regulator [Flexivirga sp.]|uniref:DeoR/GlpR family DNA-binding transcription regulator n=1 Tax=Flexivirga sp. TaxID=1962927 RepID=UPI002B53C147|nr:DeoR/GlpR family DNA-binding transcription regulator [Flexivirga sp.]HWC22624.1 DeoR/GlpR family DNA-binding transcription regulator [Flexivirga sp.]
MRKHERFNAILERIAQDGSIEVEQLVTDFGVSPATARRDLDDLADQQLISRTRGGAVAGSVSYDLPLRYKNARQSDQKRRIADHAANMIEPQSVVGFNGGTTTTEVARSLSSRADLAEGEAGALHSVTVVTNALNIASDLAVRRQLKVVVIGGVIRPQSFELVGHFARPVIEAMTIDLLFIGVDAVSAQYGAATRHDDEGEINQAMAGRAQQVVVVADSSKLGKRAFCTICPPGEIDTLLTDDGADRAVVREFEAAGIKVVQV